MKKSTLDLFYENNAVLESALDSIPWRESDRVCRRVLKRILGRVPVKVFSQELNSVVAGIDVHECPHCFRRGVGKDDKGKLSCGFCFNDPSDDHAAVSLRWMNRATWMQAWEFKELCRRTA